MAYYNCLLFDADGTLLDFDTSQRRCAQDTFSKLGLPCDDAAVSAFCEINYEMWAAVERGELRREKLFKERFVRFGKRVGVQLDAEALNKAYEQNLCDYCDLMPDAIEVLNGLSEVATLAVISNGTEKVQRSRLEGSGIVKFMDGFYVGEKGGAAKPSRRFFDMALNGLGVERRDRVLVIGDSIKADIEGGRNAELVTCYFAPEGDDGKKSHADYVIHSLKELYAIVMEKEELAEIGSTNRRHQL